MSGKLSREELISRAHEYLSPNNLLHGREYSCALLVMAAFADAMMAEEREACAKVADEEWDAWGQRGGRAETAAEIAAAIRARGEKKA